MRCPRARRAPTLRSSSGAPTRTAARTRALDRHAFALRVSSDHQGVKEAKAIAAQIEAALHHAALTLSGATLIDLGFVGAVFGRDDAQAISFGEVRFRAMTQGS